MTTSKISIFIWACCAVVTWGCISNAQEEFATEERIANYLLNESQVNDGYVVHFRLRIVKTEGETVISSFEQLGRVARKGKAARVDQQYSGLVEDTAQPVFTESSLRIGRIVLSQCSLSSGVETFDPDDKNSKYPDPSIRAKLIDPMMFAVCTYGDFLGGPKYEWAADIFSRMDELSTATLPDRRLRAIFGFPHTGSGAVVITFMNKPEFLPERIEWKMAPGAVRVANRPSADVAFAWPTTDVSVIRWKEANSHWVPVNVAKFQSFAGQEIKYEVIFTNWEFGSEKVDKLLDKEAFKTDAKTMDDFVTLGEFFTE